MSRKPRKKASDPTLAAAACEQFAVRLAEALRRFAVPHEPLWKRTHHGWMAFQGLRLDHQPPRLSRDIDRRFLAINAILEHYPIQEAEDFQLVSEADLLEVQRIIKGFLFDT